MTRISQLAFALFILLSARAYGGNLWHVAAGRNSGSNAQYRIYSLDEHGLKAQLALNNLQTIELPLPDGTLLTFKLWANNLLPAALAARHTEISTYTAAAVDNPNVTAKIDITPEGLHAMIYDGSNTSFVDPYGNTATYRTRYKRDEIANTDIKKGCQTITPANYQSGKQTTYASKTANGNQLRQYRIAIACDHQYAQAAIGTATPSKNQVFNAIVTTMNRINGVYERELSISMTLVDNEDTLIYVNQAGDPFGAADSNPFQLMTLNQKMCDSLIGRANYDLGHIFSTGAGGLSQIACVCDPLTKAQSVTGNSSPTGDAFDIDYVAHEIGHEFGAEHTFNNNSNGSCFGNASQEVAFEPSSGSTIMAYAGICGGDNVQKHSDAYFSTPSLLQIYKFITTDGSACGTKTASSNKPPALAPYTAFYTIPYQTPFELTAPEAVDSVADTLTTYCWEQFNLGDFGRTLTNTEAAGPLFRSYLPDTSRTRIFPNINMVLANIKSNAGTENAEGEKLPTVARYLTFRLTVRNVLEGHGGFLFPDDSVHLNVINTGEGFAVTSQNTADLKYIGTSVQTVAWDIANTATAPISTSDVDIYLSLDGGYTWAYNLGRFPNTGTALVTLPNLTSTTNRARIKVKGNGNVFFNVNKTDFTIITNPGVNGDILLFPVPAKNVVTVVTGDKGTVAAVVYNAVGRVTWRGEINGISDLDVSMWPRGVYIMKLMDVKNATTIKKFVLE